MVGMRGRECSGHWQAVILGPQWLRDGVHKKQDLSAVCGVPTPSVRANTGWKNVAHVGVCPASLPFSDAGRYVNYWRP